MAAALVHTPGAESREMPFVPLREFKGVASVYLDVDGLPKPIGEAGVSEKTIREAIARHVTSAGLRIVAPGTASGEAPTLRVHVLASRGESQYAYTVTAELEESCTVARKRGPQPVLCKTWWIYPRTGFLPFGQESGLENAAVLAVKEFIDVWAADNGKSE